MINSKAIMKWSLFFLFLLASFLFPSCQSLSSFLDSETLKNREITYKSEDELERKFQLCEARDGSAIVLMYHRFGETRYPSTSVSPKLLETHFQFFKKNGFTVVSMNQLISALKGDIPLGDKWIVITIDDAFKSFYVNGKAVFEKYDYPYTIFVNTEGIDERSRAYMSWEELKEISDSDLGQLEAHSHTHKYLVRSLTPDERANDILQSVRRIYENTGKIPKYFSYPYGETSTKLVNELKNMKENIDGKDFSFAAAFSTQSGPAGCSTNLFTIPRFAMNKRYGTINSLFKVKLNSRHLPVFEQNPRNKSVCIEEKIDQIGFLTDPNLPLKRINCFPSHSSLGKRAQIVSIQDGFVSLQLKAPLGFGVKKVHDLRQRVNCTLPAGEGRFFWYGREFTILKNSSECDESEEGE